MSTTVSSDAVYAEAMRVAAEVPGAAAYVGEFLERLGVSAPASDQVVVVRVTVPATTPEAAHASVESLVSRARTAYLPGADTSRMTFEVATS